MSSPRPRGGGSMSDMLRSVVVLMVLAVGIVAAQAFLGSTPDPALAVDYRPAAQAARADAPFPVLAPPELPSGWRATSVRYLPGASPSWHLGVLTDDEQYVGVEQAATPASAAVAEFAAGSTASGTQTINGEEWQLRTNPSEGRSALVRSADGATTVVGGTLSPDELASFVATLRS